MECFRARKAVSLWASDSKRAEGSCEKGAALENITRQRHDKMFRLRALQANDTIWSYSSENCKARLKVYQSSELLPGLHAQKDRAGAGVQGVHLQATMLPQHRHRHCRRAQALIAGAAAKVEDRLPRSPRPRCWSSQSCGRSPPSCCPTVQHGLALRHHVLHGQVAMRLIHAPGFRSEEGERGILLHRVRLALRPCKVLRIADI